MKRILLAASAALSISMAQAVEFQLADGYSDRLNMIGDIEYGDEVKLQRILAERNVTWIRLNSGGGNAYSGWAIAEIVRTHNIQVMVGNGDTCASACFKIFAAAQAGRYYYSTAHLGVHSSSTVDEQGNSMKEDDGSMATTLESARYLTEVGTPAAIVTTLITTSNTSITWLKASDLSGWATEWAQHLAQTAAQPAPQAGPQNYSMTCESTAKRTNYAVTLGINEIRVRDRIYPVTMQNAEADGWVVKGPTKYGAYGAVFGGANPRIAFVNTKGEVAVDRCW